MEIEGAGFEAGLEIARLESGVPSNSSKSGSVLAQRQLWKQRRVPMEGWIQECNKCEPNMCQVCAKCVPNVCQVCTKN